jgi:cephalosporin hydroxylase
MSTETIFGGWSTPRITGNEQHDRLQRLWNDLAAHEGRPNFGLSQRLAEITMLWHLYIAQAPSVVLEIGTAQGGTFAGWCQLGTDDATIISIDRCVNDCRPRPGDPGNINIYNGPLNATTNGGGVYSLRQRRQTIHALNGWSYQESIIGKLKEVLGGRNIDFLWNDASHERDMFLRDFSIYYPLVAEGGIFAVHDIMPSQHPDCNKSEAWEEIKQTADYSACFEFKGSRNDDSMGIGLLIR